MVHIRLCVLKSWYDVGLHYLQVTYLMWVHGLCLLYFTRHDGKQHS